MVHYGPLSSDLNILPFFCTATLLKFKLRSATKLTLQYTMPEVICLIHYCDKIKKVLYMEVAILPQGQGLP